MRVTGNTVTRSCAVCERTLLTGERAVRFSPDGDGEFVDVCPLCQEVALDHGWVKEGSPTTPTQTNATTNPTGSAGDAAAGKTVFASNCSICHGALGTGGNGGPNLKSIPSAKNLQRVIAQVTNGGGGMPPFKGTLSTKQIDDVATFVTMQITGK